MFKLGKWDLPPKDELRKEIARRDLLEFTKYTMPDYEVNWHHRHFCDHLMDVYSGKTKKLMVFTPPRYGKSELVSRRFPAFVLGRDPNKKIISCSYSSELSSRFNRDCQRIIMDEAYQELFPETTLNQKNIRSSAKGSYLRNSDIFEIVNHTGVYKSAGLGAAITGMGGQILILDDPLRDMAAANSPTILEKSFDWYTSTFQTRLEKDGAIVIVLTRWTEDDIAGRLLRLEPDEWTVVSYPALLDCEPMYGDPRQPGEALWPEKYDLEALQKTKHTVGTRVWEALYQQRPTTKGGNIVDSSWWQYYDEMPDFSQFDFICASWDFSFKGTEKSDYVVGQVWAKLGPRRYLLHMVRAQMGFNRTVAEVMKVNDTWPLNVTLIEEKANGAAIIDTIKSKVPGIKPINPKESKEARVHAMSPQVEAGNVFIPRDQPWVSDFIEEFSKFPRFKTDDIVDATSQALNYLSKKYAWLEHYKQNELESKYVDTDRQLLESMGIPI